MNHTSDVALAAYHNWDFHKRKPGVNKYPNLKMSSQNRKTFEKIIQWIVLNHSRTSEIFNPKVQEGCVLISTRHPLVTLKRRCRGWWYTLHYNIHIPLSLTPTWLPPLRQALDEQGPRQHR